VKVIVQGHPRMWRQMAESIVMMEVVLSGKELGVTVELCKRTR
jgi:hypothetical protein